VAVGFESLYVDGGNSNVAVGYHAGYNTTSASNTFLGNEAGKSVTSGANNTILGAFNGNEGGLDIRTSSNNIVLSDGDGQIGMHVNSTGSAIFGSGFSTSIDRKSVHARTIDNTNISYAMEAVGTQSGADGRLYFWDFNNTNSGTAYFVYAQNSGGNCFNVRGDGDVENLNNSYGGTSDLKLKENIQDASSQWDDIKALRVRKYSYIADDLDAPNQLGVIAQELETAGMSGLVTDSPDTNMRTGEDLGTVTKTVKYSILYMKAVKALQEAMDRIETLEAKVTALENA